MAWRLSILQHAASEHWHVAQTCRFYGISRTAFYQMIDQREISDDILLFKDKLREWEGYYKYVPYCPTSLCG